MTTGLSALVCTVPFSWPPDCYSSVFNLGESLFVDDVLAIGAAPRKMLLLEQLLRLFSLHSQEDIAVISEKPTLTFVAVRFE